MLNKREGIARSISAFKFYQLHKEKSYIIIFFFNLKVFINLATKNKALTSVRSTLCQVVHYVKIIRLKHLGKKAMKQQGTWLVYCLSFVYEAVFKFNYYSKLNSNRHQETSLYTTKLKKKKKIQRFQHQIFQISWHIQEEISRSVTTQEDI